MPVGVEALVETLKVEDPEVLTEVGLKLLVAFAGRPVTASDTLPLKLFTAFTVAV